MNYHTEEGSNIDRLSSLHDSTLLHILSFLPTKDSIKTSVLSKRFRHAWASVPALNFTINNLQDADAVDRVLALHSSPSIPTFRIAFGRNVLLYFLRSPHTCSWIDHAAARNTRDLRIDLHRCRPSIFDRIFRCQSLEALELKGQFKKPVQPPSPLTPFFTNLTTLKLHLTDVSNNKTDLIGDLISSCRNLQVLCLHAENLPFIRVSAPGLRRLELLVGWSRLELEVSCRGLEEFYLTIKSGMCHWLEKFQGDMPSLRRASFKTEFHGYSSAKENCPAWTPMFRSVTSAEILQLYCLDYKICQQILKGSNHQSQPTFQNLKTLELGSCFHYDNVEFMVHLLENSPRLNFLTISLVPTCKCDEKRNKWTSRKLPAKFLDNLMSVSILNGRRQRVINKGEFVKFLSTNVSEWNKVIKRL